MTHLLDTDRLVDFLAGRAPAIELVGTLLRDGLAISIITYLEVVEGILGSREPQAGHEDFRRFLQGVEVLFIDEAIANRTAAIRLALRRQKRQVNERAFDLLIAATALEHDLTLVSRNTRDYGDIPGLLLYRAAVAPTPETLAHARNTPPGPA